MTSGRAAISRHATGPWPVHLALGAAQTGFALLPTLGKREALTASAAAVVLFAVSVSRPRPASPNDPLGGPPSPLAAEEVG